MVGDTRFTPEVSGGRDGQTQFIGGLKIVLLHPGVAVAFAHNTENARQAIEGIHSRGVNLFNKVDVLDYLLDHHRRSQQQGSNAMVEFIAAFELDSRNSELFLVKNGDVVWVDAGYIGNTDAYASFLEHEHQLTVSKTPLPPIAIAIQALDAVIRDTAPSLRNVDGFSVALRHSTNDGFVYVHSVRTEGRPSPVRPGPGAPVTFGGAAAGANEWVIGSSPGDRFGVLTAFCHTGSFGVIYRPALDFTPRIVRGCTANELAVASLLEVDQIEALLNQM